MSNESMSSSGASLAQEQDILEQEKEEEIVTHMDTPTPVKSIYYTAYAANSEKKIEDLIHKITTTEINSVTIDIKTVSGYVSFDMPEQNF